MKLVSLKTNEYPLKIDGFRHFLAMAWIFSSLSTRWIHTKNCCLARGGTFHKISQDVSCLREEFIKSPWDLFLATQKFKSWMVHGTVQTDAVPGRLTPNQNAPEQKVTGPQEGSRMVLPLPSIFHGDFSRWFSGGFSTKNDGFVSLGNCHPGSVETIQGPPGGSTRWALYQL